MVEIILQGLQSLESFRLQFPEKQITGVSCGTTPDGFGHHCHRVSDNFGYSQAAATQRGDNYGRRHREKEIIMGGDSHTEREEIIMGGKRATEREEIIMGGKRATEREEIIMGGETEAHRDRRR